MATGQEWAVRRWTPEEIDALMQCEVVPTVSERQRRFRYGGETADLCRFAEESGRTYQAVKAKYHYERCRRRGGRDPADSTA